MLTFAFIDRDVGSINTHVCLWADLSGCAPAGDFGTPQVDPTLSFESVDIRIATQTPQVVLTAFWRLYRTEAGIVMGGRRPDWR